MEFLPQKHGDNRNNSKARRGITFNWRTEKSNGAKKQETSLSDKNGASKLAHSEGNFTNKSVRFSGAERGGEAR